MLMVLELSFAAGFVFEVLVFDDLVFDVLVLWVDFDAGFIESVVASFGASALAAGAAGAAAGAGACAAAVSDTAKAPASSADINLVIFPSSVKCGYKVTQMSVSGALTPFAPDG